jgi:hypothetical protein
VLLALKSGEWAADAVVEGLKNGETSGAQLGKWGPQFSKGMDRMRRLLCEYYSGFNIGNFVRKYPHLQSPVTDLLVGHLFSDHVDQIWEPMASMREPGEPPIPSWDANLTEDETGREPSASLPRGWKP